VTSPYLGGLGSDRPVRLRPSLQVLLDRARREAPAILTVDAAASGHAFYQAANGV